MAEVKRKDDEWSSGPTDPSQSRAEPARGDYRPGGIVGEMQANLAHRLALTEAIAALPQSPGERTVRFLSIAGGYAALLAGYVGVTLLLLR